MSELAILGGAPIRMAPYPAWPVWDQREEQALIDVLHSGEWGGYNPRVKEFELAFAKRAGVRHAVALANGTVTLVAALRAAGIGPGDEVIVPPYTFAATATSVALAGACPVFADVDPSTFTLSAEAASAAITEHTRAVVPVHFAGQMADLDALRSLASAKQLFLLEDAAQAHGASWKGHPAGSLGDCGSFSFQASKNMTAGEGGILLTDSPELREAIWAEGNQGRTPDGPWYDHPSLGSNYRLAGFQAAILLVQLQRLDAQVAIKERNARLLDCALHDLPGLSPQGTHAGQTSSGRHLYVFRYDPSAFAGLPRERFLAALTAEGIPCSAGYPRPLHQQPVFTHGRLRRGRHPRQVDFPPSGWTVPAVTLPVAEQLCREAVWLPQNVLLGSERDLDDVLEAIRRIQRHAPRLAAFSL